MILAGDIGGTNTRLACFEEVNGVLLCKYQAKYPSKSYPNLTGIVAEFVSAHKVRVEQCAFGVAGPVVNGRVKATNLPWLVDSADIAEAIGTDNLYLLNDLEANTWGIDVLHEDDFLFLNQGAGPRVGNAAVISPGTGLGEAGLFWDGKKHHPFACEGGHADFAPRDEIQIELLEYLMKRWEHVSWERVLSGPGLYNIYSFLRDSGRSDEPAWLAESMKVHDPGKTVTENAMAGTSALCERALELFCSLYASEAGNLALKVMALGGVYLGGGITPKIVPKLLNGTFMQEFSEKGRMKEVLQTMPVRVILNENTALLGAAHYAATFAEHKSVAAL